METHIEITGSLQHVDWKSGDTGLIDGYVRGADDCPYAVVVLDKSGTFVCVPIHLLKKTL